VGAERLPSSVSQVGKVAPFHTQERGTSLIRHTRFSKQFQSPHSRKSGGSEGMRRGRSSLFLGRLYFDLVLYI
jgi:hypothetical protein